MEVVKHKDRLLRDEESDMRYRPSSGKSGWPQLADYKDEDNNVRCAAQRRPGSKPLLPVRATPSTDLQASVCTWRFCL